MDVNLRVGNGSVDTGNNYAWRSESNGTADTTGTSTNLIQLFSSSSAINYNVEASIVNIASSFKPVFVNIASTTATVAGAPGKRIVTGVWGNSSNVIDTISLIASTGNLGAAQLIVLGHN